MAERNPSAGQPRRYRYRLLRYVSNPFSGEFYNVALIVYDEDGAVLDARFSPDLRRMRCNPGVGMEFLRELRNEFDEARLLGEDFSGYLERLIEHHSNRLSVSELAGGVCQDIAAETERLVQQQLITPALEEESSDPVQRFAASRQRVRRRMAEAFERNNLFRNGHGVQRDFGVTYGRLNSKFVFDFQYRDPSEGEHFLQAMGLQSGQVRAGNLCFVLQEYRKKHDGAGQLAVVADDSLGDDVRNLLSEGGIGAVNLSTIDTYAASIRQKLGL